MKKNIFLYLLYWALSSSGQITNLTNNFGVPTDFVGWNAGNAFPLLIEHRDAAPFVQQIRFSTGAASGGERVRFTDLAFGAQLQPYAGALTNPLPGNQMTRVRINYDAGLPIGVGGIDAGSLLHIGTDWFTNGATGVRSWQNIGTLTMAGGNHLWIGLREKDNGVSPFDGRVSVAKAVPNGEKDAVINWGDNYKPCHPQNGSQTNLCFVFTSHGAPIAPCPGDDSNTDYGLELMRMNGEGRIGIGPRFTDIAEPQHILHVNTAGTDPSFIQVTNAVGTNQTVTDGLLLGKRTTTV